jgi:hypothetical protein
MHSLESFIPSYFLETENTSDLLVTSVSSEIHGELPEWDTFLGDKGERAGDGVGRDIP